MHASKAEIWQFVCT